jgi:hypothetical protein
VPAGRSAASPPCTGGRSATPGPTTRTLNRESIYDYQYAAASPDYGAVVWMDARDAAVCPAVNAYRQFLIDGTPIAAPSPLTDCPPTFGNLDIYSGSFLDPTP